MTLIGVSVFATALLVFVSLTVAGVIPGEVRLPFAGRFAVQVALLLPPLAAVVSALFVVRGYRLSPGELLVDRLFWATRVELAGLTRAVADPSAMKGSLRIFGNGGLYSVTGLFYSSTLGRYRAFVTDQARAVVLFVPSRTVVLSPEDPAAFLQQLRVFVPGVRVDGPPASGRP